MAEELTESENPKLPELSPEEDRFVGKAVDGITRIVGLLAIPSLRQRLIESSKAERLEILGEAFGGYCLVCGGSQVASDADSCDCFRWHQVINVVATQR